MLTSRERVLITLDHKEADRIPICPPGGRVNISDKVKGFLRDFDFDRFASLNFVKNIDERQELSHGIYVDDYGCIYKHRGVSEIPYCIYNPLGNAKRVEEIEKYRKWPDPDDPSLISKDAEKKAKKIREETDQATTVNVGSIFHRYSWMRGFNKWLLDMKFNPEIYEAIASKICDIRLRLSLNLLKEVGEYADLIQMNDDLGSTNGPFMSIQDFRKFVKPYYERLIKGIKKEYPKIRFWLHSHGAIMKLVPEFIDLGIDVLNPILPGDNMNPNVLKRKFGRNLCFDGGADVEYVIPFGTVKQVKEHVKEVVEILAPGGGYIFKVQMISNLVSYENLSAAYNTAMEYGRYDH